MASTFDVTNALKKKVYLRNSRSQQLFKIAKQLAAEISELEKA